MFLSEFSGELVFCGVGLNYPKPLMLNMLLEGHGNFTRQDPAEDLWVISIVPLNEIMGLFLFPFSL